MNVRQLVIAAVTATLFVPSVSQAQIGTTTTPVSSTSEIGARIRWGATGFEGSLYDSGPFTQTPQLNPTGAPVWQVGQAYNFQVTYVSSTGTLGLDIDFNRDNSFGAGESIIRNSFASPSLTDYTGYGFRYLSISGNESGSTARSTVSNLVINGVSVPTLAPNGQFIEQFYTNPAVNATGDYTITGALSFSTAGTSQERPSWNIVFRDAVQNPNVAVPEPASLALLATGMAAMMLVRRRRA